MVVRPLLEILTDGQCHSGEDLGGRLGISRTAVWKQIQYLRGWGLEIAVIKGKGYRLSRTMELLDEGLIRSRLPPVMEGRIRTLEVSSLVPSTNTHLQEHLKSDLGGGQYQICLAEYQTAGKGRRGRRWVSPFGANLYLSLGTGIGGGITKLEGLSLVMGLALVSVLKGEGYAGVGLKWPNDILLKGRKLAGILIETAGEIEGQHQVIIGIGLNIDMGGSLETAAIEQPWAQLVDETNSMPGRNYLAARVIETAITFIERFIDNGFADFQDEWNATDAYAGQSVALVAGGDRIQGVNRGVNERGHLRLQIGNGMKVVAGGELSLRVQ